MATGSTLSQASDASLDDAGQRHFGEADSREISGPSHVDPPTFTIHPTNGLVGPELAELWRYRELFWIFAVRDIKVRYKQTVLGAAWALIQPIAFTLVGTIVFGGVAGASNDDVTPVFLFYLASQLPWMLFNTGLQSSSMSLVTAQNMIKKVYFPRLVLPTSAVMVAVVDAFIQFCMILLVIAALPLIPGVPSFLPPIQVVLLPLAVAWAFIAALAIGLPLAALNVQYRDVRYVVPFVTQFMIFAAPVFWSASVIPDRWRLLYGLMPVAGPIDFFRWCLLDTPAHPWMWLTGAIGTSIGLVLGLIYFQRMEETFADVV